ncbi:MAG: hypothetical protein JWQ09_772 [Segetibacter sp.]|nr:hypothetical protein [Segetibacter sp.]
MFEVLYYEEDNEIKEARFFLLSTPDRALFVWNLSLRLINLSTFFYPWVISLISRADVQSFNINFGGRQR